MNPGPRSQCRQCKKYCKATDKVVKCQECSKCFHVSCANLSEKELGSEKEYLYCKDCKAECGLCSGDVLNNHKADQCDKCDKFRWHCISVWSIEPIQLGQKITSLSVD